MWAIHTGCSDATYELSGASALALFVVQPSNLVGLKHWILSLLWWVLLNSLRSVFSLPAAAFYQIYWNLPHICSSGILRNWIFVHRFGDPPFSFLLSKIFLPMHCHCSTPRLHYLIPSVVLCCSDWGVPSLEKYVKIDGTQCGSLPLKSPPVSACFSSFTNPFE